MELAETLDPYAISPNRLFNHGNRWFSDGKISFTQYSLLSIPCEKLANHKTQPMNAIEFFESLKGNEEFADGVDDQLTYLISFLSRFKQAS